MILSKTDLEIVSGITKNNDGCYEVKRTLTFA